MWLILLTAFVSFCILYYINRKTALRRRMLRERMQERREHMMALLQQLRKNKG